LLIDNNNTAIGETKRDKKPQRFCFYNHENGKSLRSWWSYYCGASALVWERDSFPGVLWDLRSRLSKRGCRTMYVCMKVHIMEVHNVLLSWNILHKFNVEPHLIWAISNVLLQRYGFPKNTFENSCMKLCIKCQCQCWHYVAL
jgi:hypothetical protein